MTLDIYGHLFPRHDDSEELAAAERSWLLTKYLIQIKSCKM
jgi:hypothetical protein